jgi:acylphosphatase
MLIARRYLVRGRGQGVGFRYFTEDVALREGIRGYVRNLPDGGVEVSGEGEAEAVARFERAIRRGPPAARVESVDVDELPPSGRPTGFRVKG